MNAPFNDLLFYFVLFCAQFIPWIVFLGVPGKKRGISPSLRWIWATPIAVLTILEVLAYLGYEWSLGILWFIFPLLFSILSTVVSLSYVSRPIKGLRLAFPLILFFQALVAIFAFIFGYLAAAFFTGIASVISGGAFMQGFGWIVLLPFLLTGNFQINFWM
ncbi:MAG TPA: hypothetical protein VFL98_02785 [Candidatus Paceibacterota bacterium]|nr:hypothetical protein [Candidatus Paceibacterota bacterium]